MEVVLFKSSVKIIAQKFSPTSWEDRQDIEQELWLKLIEVMPKLKTVKDSELVFMAKVILRNHAIDLMRKRKVREPLLNHVQFDQDSEEFTIANAVNDLYAFIPSRFESQQDFVSFKLLVKEVNNWADKEGGSIKKFLNELINPSQSTLDTWDKMCEENPGYNVYDIIPPSSFAKILGIPKLKITRAMARLRKHLNECGHHAQFA